MFSDKPVSLGMIVTVAPESNELMSTLGAIAKRVDHRLAQLLPSELEAPSELHAAMRYSALAPGKRLRPALVMLACQAVGGNEEAALDAGCAIEMIHAFSLIHDDLPAIDNDDLRRGLPTCHIRFGEAVALLAGDALFALAFETLASLPLPAASVVEIMKVVSKCVGSNGLVGGETIDVLSEGKSVSKETLDQIHVRKTASLIAASCEVGALTAPSLNTHLNTALRSYGESIGLAFQIADDVLNETSTAEQLGKAVGSDKERGKATYPSLYGLEASKTRALDLAHEASELVANFPNEATLRAVAEYSVLRLN